LAGNPDMLALGLASRGRELAGGEDGEWKQKRELTVKYVAGNRKFEGLNGE